MNLPDNAREIKGMFTEANDGWHITAHVLTKDDHKEVLYSHRPTLDEALANMTEQIHGVLTD